MKAEVVWVVELWNVERCRWEHTVGIALDRIDVLSAALENKP